MMRYSLKFLYTLYLDIFHFVIVNVLVMKELCGTKTDKLVYGENSLVHIESFGVPHWIIIYRYIRIT
ncbi:hypothetical protein NQ317_010720 [Molorchus minor]|uniref:Uncharacterized protein n=1 Tax=Molorchus minor TaxID=1323400 RepID=A0ABQ9K7E3_9CUCU|nr:hypothetical protein NQ317_010720 [Molorchus minor]